MNEPGAPIHQRGEISSDGRHYWDGDVWKWQSLWLVADEVAKAAHDRFGRTATAVHFLASGMLNQSWHVETGDGSCVLRISRPERTREQVAYEHQLLRRLKDQVREMVAPVLGRDGETVQFWAGHILSLFPFVHGAGGELVESDVRWPQSAHILARLHRASLDHVLLGQRPGFRSFDDEWRSIWHEVSPVLHRDLDGRDGFDELFSALASDVVRLERWLDDLPERDRTLVHATIHGDFNPRNVIFRDDNVVAVIDWDECRLDPIAWEVAQCAFEAPEIDPFAFWSAYLEAGGPLLPRDVDLLPSLARIGALLQLQYTVKDGRATPHAMQQVEDIITELGRIGEIDAV